ncbi:MAG: hypothetical protein WC372_12560 [Candidatus Neomarinimicrobiota bacterium]
MAKETNPKIQVTLSPKLLRVLETHAKEHGLSKASVTRVALGYYFRALAGSKLPTEVVQ